mmetsp:Transcript_27905/g.78204  ORF Transcript_27905/g.78204 Transcript_27905/m.78204 type:complete len:236 (+) Transcript_27905:544-1251(+)
MSGHDELHGLAAVFFQVFTEVVRSAQIRFHGGWYNLHHADVGTLQRISHCHRVRVHRRLRCGIHRCIRVRHECQAAGHVGEHACFVFLFQKVRNEHGCQMDNARKVDLDLLRSLFPASLIFDRGVQALNPCVVHQGVAIRMVLLDPGKKFLSVGCAAGIADLVEDLAGMRIRSLLEDVLTPTGDDDLGRSVLEELLHQTEADAASAPGDDGGDLAAIERHGGWRRVVDCVSGRGR